MAEKKMAKRVTKTADPAAKKAALRSGLINVLANSTLGH